MLRGGILQVGPKIRDTNGLNPAFARGRYLGSSVIYSGFWNATYSERVLAHLVRIYANEERPEWDIWRLMDMVADLA